MRFPILAIVVAASAALPAGARALAFAPGEETVLAISYLGLPTGEGRIAVGDPIGDLWPVTFQARTAGVAGFLDVREHLVCAWDAPTQLPRGSDLRAFELGDAHADSLHFDRAANLATVSVERRDRRREKTVAVPPGAQDLTGAFMWLRLQPLEMGERHQIPVLTGSKLFELTAEVVGRRAVRTPAGTFDTVEVRVHLELAGQFQSRRDIQLWFSDDPRHVLVRVEADLALGGIVAELERYHPGQALAAADRRD